MTQVPRSERGTSTSVAQALLVQLAKLSHSNPRVRIAIGSSVAAALVAAYAYRARCGGRRHDRARIANEPDSSREQREASVADDPRSRAKRSRSKRQSAEKLFWFLLRIARPRVLAMAGLAVLRTMLSNRLSRLQGHLFRAAFLRKVPLFARNLLENVMLCAALSAVTSTVQHCLAQLHLGWRRTLTQHLHSKYFDNMTYYRLSHVDQSMALPEQHICEDVPKLCEGLADLVGEVLNAASDASFYSWRLRSYSGTNLYTLVLCAYILKAGTLMAVLAPNFSKLHKRSAQLEGLAEEAARTDSGILSAPDVAMDQLAMRGAAISPPPAPAHHPPHDRAGFRRWGRFRQLLSRLSANGEAVAFYGGLKREGAVLRRAFSALVGHKARLHRTQHRFGIVQDFLLKYLGATVAVVLIIGPFFSGKLKPTGTVAGRAHMLSNMRYHTGVVISLFAALGTLAATSRKLMKLRAHADRVLSLQQRINELHQRRCGQQPHGTASGAVVAASEEAISFEGVMVATPSNTTLVKDLSLRVPAGTNLLVTGPNGAGKSSLFRVLGGLWPLQRGTIRKPGGNSTASGLSSDIFYVPQRPYVTVGSLQDQLIYPHTVQDGGSDVIDPEEMVRLLRMVDLQHLLDWERTRLQHHQPAAFDWGAKLSLGEQQRLGMARLFYHRPRFAILDECTSGVTVDMELRFANQVKDMGCTCITISHRPALMDFHDLVLALDGEGGWSLLPGRRAAAAAAPGAAPPAQRGGTSGVAAGSEGSVRGGHAEQCNSAMQAGAQDEQQNDQRQQQRQLVARAPAEIDGSASMAASMRHVLAGLEPRWRSARHRLQVIARLLAAGSSADGAQVAVIAVVVLLRTLLQDRIASLNGRTVKYVLMQDRAAFVQLIGVSIIQSACSSVLAPSLKYITESLALSWRKRATEAVLSKYLQGNGPYACSDLAGIQDADSRISSDIEWLTQDLAQLIPTMVKPAVDITWFSWQMWRLTGLRGLGLLYLYMALGFGVLRAVTPPFGQLAAEQLRLEAAFRSSHERLRTHAESVAFFGGGAREGRSIAMRLRELLTHLHQMVRLRWPHGAADDFFAKQLPHNATWALTLLYALDRAPNGLGRATDQGELVHDMRYLASVVGNCFSAFGELLALGKHLAELWGGVVRTTDLAQVARKCSSLRTGPWIERVPPPAPTSAMQGSLQAATLPRISEEVDYGDGTIVFNGVDVVAPSGTVLARQLSLKVQPGTNLLVTGPNGSGKTSIFRLLRGIWPVLSGELTGPCHGPLGADHSYRIFHVPQRPYTSIGTLREQIVYPLTVDEACDREAPGSRSSQLAALDVRLEQLMAAVRLQYLLHREGWDAQADDWSQVLSLGEQQRLGMARLFFHRPRVAVLDECTNATSVDVEGGLFLTASRLGITLITITQRTALLQYHHLELRLLDGVGDWQLRRIAHSPPTAAATLTDDTAPQLMPEQGC